MIRSMGSPITLIIMLMLVWPSAATAGTSNLAISASGATGTGQTDQPGLSCADGGSGASWRYDYTSALPGGAFSSVPSELGLHLEVHSEGTGDPAVYDGAWLPTDSSSVLLENGRGTVRLTLASGGPCGVDTLAFDGTTVSGSGTWSASGTGSYRDAVGSGSFSLTTASVGPGSDNPFSLQLNGPLTVLDPSLGVEVVEAVKEHGKESGFHHALVTFAVTNAGPGDTFGARLVQLTGSTADLTLVSSVPQAVGDLAAGAKTLVQVRFRCSRPSCKPEDKGSPFEATLDVEMPDALDRPATFSSSVPIRIPTHSKS